MYSISVRRSQKDTLYTQKSINKISQNLFYIVLFSWQNAILNFALYIFRAVNIINTVP